jgi:ring-1,2-phenylacetyl-CoA epoxidase subunit PaaD
VTTMTEPAVTATTAPTTTAPGQARAYQVAAATPDPELPTLTIEDLGILRDVRYSPPGENGAQVTVTITPTYSGCPAMREITADIHSRLTRAGFPEVTINTQLAPPWTTDWITEDGHRKLSANGIAPPTPAPRRSGPIPLTLTAPPPAPCPRCGSVDTRRTAEFSATACKSLHRCNACNEPFEGVKAL